MVGIVRIGLVLFLVSFSGAASAQYQVLQEGAGEETPSAIASEYHWTLTVDGDDVVLAGQVPYASVSDLLTEKAGPAVANQMTVGQGAPLGFMRDAIAAVDASALIETGIAQYRDGQWSISGKLRQGRSVGELEAALGGDHWVIDVAQSAIGQPTPDTEQFSPSLRDGNELDQSEPSDLVSSGSQDRTGGDTANDSISESPEAYGADGFGTALEQAVERVQDAAPSVDAREEPANDDAMAALVEDSINPVPSQGAAPVDDGLQTVLPESTVPDAEAAPEGIEQCRQQTSAYMQDRSILFASGSARITPETGEILADLAAIFAICPQAPIYVEGHTDAAGNAEANLQLSLARAEAVVEKLVELGTASDRIYAAGYGASLPVASNDTVAGRAQNRRIVFSFEDIAASGGAEQ